MLHHRVDAGIAPRIQGVIRGLEAVDIGAGHVRIEVAVLAKGTAYTGPSGLCCKVDLRGKGRCNA